MTSFQLTLLKMTKPLSDGYVSMSTEWGKLRMSQTKTPENFPNVMAGIALSTA